MPYEADHAQLYDLVFRSRGKDFEGEVADVTDLVRDRAPGARSLLDVACGTGAHLDHYRKLFDDVEGLEYAPAMLDVARRSLDGVPLHLGDMRAFDLGRRFDAVVSLGNSVACLDSADELDTAVATMVEHLAPGGVLVIEPWFFPENFLDGHVGGHLVDDGERVITRLTRSTLLDGRTCHDITFTVAERAGIRTFSERLLISLWTRERYETAFRRAGLDVAFVPGLDIAGRPNSPGLFVGVRR